MSFAIKVLFCVALRLQGLPVQATPPQPQTFETSGGVIRISAQIWQKDKDRIYATGDVDIVYNDLRLYADRIELDTKTKDILAEGNVVIQFPEETVTAARVIFNLDDKRGRLEQVDGRIQPNFFYRASTLERKADDVYSFGKSRFTACTQPVPRWNFSCSKANFRKNDYVEMWNAVLTIKKVPVFYLPYFRYPLGKERSTGFLIPQIGISGPKGFFFNENFYWAIARNMDATFAVDSYGARGVGLGVESRYLFGGGTGGEARFYYFMFKEDPEKGPKPPDAWILRLNHNQPLPWDFSLTANIDYQQSFDFLREFDNNYRRALISNRSSEVYLTRSWSHYSFSARASRFETYFTQIDNSIISTSLPEISLSSFRTRLVEGLPFYFSFGSSFRRWQYGWRGDYEAKTQRQAQNMSFQPELSVPLSMIPWLSLNGTFSANFTYHSQSLKPNTGVVIDEPVLASNYVIRAEALGPSFYKIYEGGWLFGADTRIKHLIEPFVSYQYDSPVAQANRIITPAGFYRYHQLSYGLTNRIYVKQEGQPREVFTLGLSQTYYLAPEQGPLSSYRLKDGKPPKFSEVSSYVRFYPAGKVSLDFGASFNTYFKQLSSIRLSANFNSQADPYFLSLSWYKSMNPWYKNVLLDRHQIGAFGGAKIPWLHLSALAEMDFNITERKMLYSGLSLVYHFQCLDFKADMRIFYFRDQPETQFKFSIGLGNIGKTTDFLGGMEIK